jgi:hypothetical protein
MTFRVAHLHGWIPRTDLAGPDHEWEEDGRLLRMGIEWSPVEPVELCVEGDAKLTFAFTMQAPVTRSPRRTVETGLNVRVSVADQASIDQLERDHLRPWLVFSTFVADRWDSPTFHQVARADKRLPVRVLHEGRTAVAREWEPGRNLYLFSAEDCGDIPGLRRAEDCGDIPGLLTRWLELYRHAGLPIAVYAETLRDGNS